MSQSVEWIFDWALSHTRRSDAVEIRVDTLAQIRLSTSFESSLVSVKIIFGISEKRIEKWLKFGKFLFKNNNSNLSGQNA